MENVNDFFSMLNDEHEALMVLSALGFHAVDYSAIVKLGGARELLQNNLGIKALEKFLKTHPATGQIFKNLRSLLDTFYGDSGSLLTPLKAPNLSVFRLPSVPLTYFSRFEHRLIGKGPSIAIVGSRAACEQGRENSFRLAKALSEQGFTIISGGARGVDEEAHRGALQGPGSTVLVTGLACSLKKDVLYERASEKYREKMSILYPFGPFFPQAKYMFVERNHFVVALADAVVIVQGQQGSGTLHTVKFAEKLGKPIFAIPGDIKNPLSLVPNALIESGRARALTDFGQDFYSFLKGFSLKTPKKILSREPNRIAAQQKLDDMPELLRFFLENGRAMTMPELVNKTKKPFLELQKELLSYELSGQIVKRGPQFVLARN